MRLVRCVGPHHAPVLLPAHFERSPHGFVIEEALPGLLLDPPSIQGLLRLLRQIQMRVPQMLNLNQVPNNFEEALINFLQPYQDFIEFQSLSFMFI